tara:strand:+ start:213 stop:452 length:240 start_codon:yes stop_codon:yes gene_type:complete
MTKQDKLDLAVDLADHTIDYVYETIANQLDWHDFNTDDEYDEDQFMIAHDEVMRLTITEIAKRLTNINGVSTLLTNMKQ